MKVKDIMDKYPITVMPDTNVQEIAILMDKHHVAAVPVVDDDNKLLGIVSEGDLLYKKSRPQAPHYVNLLGASIYYSGIGEYNENFHKLLATRSEELMTCDVITCSGEEEVETISALMIDKKIKVIPVVKGGRVVGTIGRRHIIKLIAEGE